MTDARRFLVLAMTALLFTAAARAADRPAWWVERDGATGGVPWQEITYLSGGLRVKGFLFDSPVPGRRPALVFNHGGVSGVSADMMRRSADLARAGYMVLTPTYRGEGGSEGVIEVARGEVDDVLAAAAILRGHSRVDPKRIGLVGSSHGALISVLAATRDPHVRAVAAACGVMDVHAWYRYLVDNGFDVSDSLSVAVYGRGPEDKPEAFQVRSAVGVAGKLRVPLLLQQGVKDRTVPPDQAWRMSAALERAGRPKPSVLTYPLLGHAFWFWDRKHHTDAEVDEAEQAWRDLLAFLASHLTPGDAAAIARAAGPTLPAGYEEELREWRTRRQERLTAEEGWLAVAGLTWLQPGLNRLGSAADNEVRLPEGSAPARTGSLMLEGDQVTLEVLPGVAATLGGEPVTRRALRSDADGAPDVVSLNDLRLSVIRRSKGFAVRMRHLNAPARRDFQGLDYYPVDPSWLVEARFVPYDPPKPVEIPNIIGTVDTVLAPGYLEFEREGRTVRLDPILEEGAEELFLIFRDGTSGTETYPPGRFLYAPRPVDGRVTLDFNRAYNPPCAFTPFATCPLPPEQNSVPLPIRAGEKRYAGGDGAGH